MKKKILENPLFASFVVPLAVVLVGAVIVFGVTSILSDKKTYHDLLSDLESQSFSNKGAAAYELSKVIASAAIPAPERAQVAARLAQIYESGVDSKTRAFLISAMGALQQTTAAPALIAAAQEKDKDIRFHALVALANMPAGTVENLASLVPLTSSDDLLIAQAAMLALAQHRVPEARNALLAQLASSQQLRRYTAAQGLMNFKSELALPVLREILLAPYPATAAGQQVNAAQLINLKLDVLHGMQRNDWAVLPEVLAQVAAKDEKEQVALKAKELLNLLKY